MPLLSPIENGAAQENGIWTQVKPRITQIFGVNKSMYAQFGLEGHDGIDWGVPVGTPIYASFEGTVKTKDDGHTAYGLHIMERSAEGARECVYGHLSELLVKDGDRVNPGQMIAKSGNTGNSTGPHLHWGFRFLTPGAGDIFTWAAKDSGNGFLGWVDPFATTKVIAFKGTVNGLSTIA